MMKKTVLLCDEKKKKRAGMPDLEKKAGQGFYYEIPILLFISYKISITHLKIGTQTKIIQQKFNIF